MDAGYLTDVEYTGEFFDHLAPAWLNYIAAINGYEAPSLDGGFAWCELGCGKGITSLLLAAAYPGGEFHACDFNAAHIDYAERLRKASGLENITFHAKNFAQMLDTPLPQFDYIVLHGVYSWVPVAARGEIREIIRRKLKAGGLAMVSYNAMPGWAYLQPIRRMMNAYAASLPGGDSIEKAKQAFAYADFLARNGAGYFSAVPAAAQHLRSISKQDVRYVAHEYITPYGDPFYFPEVEQDMRDAGLSFAGCMAPEDNYIELMGSPKFRKLLESAPTRSMLESHRDVIANTAFRRDLFAAQEACAQPREVALDRLDKVAFCLVNLPERLPLKSERGAVQFNLEQQKNSVRIVHEVLAKAPASASEIHRALGGAPEQTSFLIQQLVVAKHIAPCPTVRASAGWSAFNSAMVEAGIREQLPRIPLAALQTGSASYSEVVQAAVIESVARFRDSGEAARSVLRRMREQGHPVNRHTSAGEARPATDAEVVEYVTAAWRGLNDAANPDAKLLRMLGVLN